MKPLYCNSKNSDAFYGGFIQAPTYFVEATRFADRFPAQNVIYLTVCFTEFPQSPVRLVLLAGANPNSSVLALQLHVKWQVKTYVRLQIHIFLLFKIVMDI